MIDIDAAVCRQTDPDLWFPDKGGDPALAKRLCLTCPLVEPCLQAALDNGEQWGIWGATTSRERQHILRKRVAA